MRGEDDRAQGQTDRKHGGDLCHGEEPPAPWRSVKPLGDPSQ